MSKTNIKARRMWACKPRGMSFEVYHSKSEATNFGDYPGDTFRVAVLDISDPKELVEKVAECLRKLDGWGGYHMKSVNVLKTLGIFSAKKRRAKK